MQTACCAFCFAFTITAKVAIIEMTKINSIK